MKADFQIEQLKKALLPRLSSFYKEGFDGFAIHSSSIVICADAGCAKMFGYEEDEMTGVNTWSHFKPESARSILQHLSEKSEEPYTVTAINRDRNEFKVELQGKDFKVNGIPVRAVWLRKIA
ncbi:MAG: PAS domain-containing protein [Acidiferrobacterales bacterium]